MEVLPATRRRSLEPNANGSIDGWMDHDIASAATQLFGSGQPGGVLVIDHREILTSTARAVGQQLGEVHLKVFMALITLHVTHGMPSDGRGYTTASEMAQIIWGRGTQGGSDTKTLLRALNELRGARFTLPGYDAVSGRAARGVSDTNLLSRLYLDDVLLKAYETPGATGMTAADFGRQFGGKSGTIGWQLDELYTGRLREAELRRFDWSKAQKLRGVALAMWWLFTSPEIPYHSVLGASEDGLEKTEAALTPEACALMGVLSGQPAGRRRTINQAGERICAADSSFVSFEAHGSRGQPGFLRVVRRRPTEPLLERPYGEQLTLDAA